MAQNGRSLTKGEKILIGTVTAFVVLVLTGLFWWMDLNETPQVAIPDPVMPVPNARDTFIAATGQMQQTQVLEDTLSAAAGSTRVKTPPTQAQVDVALAANAPAIATLRTGFEQEYLSEPCRSFDQVFPYYAKYRGMARCLNVDVRARSKRGDWDGALRSDLDCLQLGATIPRGGFLITGLVGIACEAIARSVVWVIPAHLTGPQAKAHAKRLEGILARRVPVCEIYEGEKWAAISGIMEIFRKPNWRKELSSMGGMEDIESDGAQKINPRLYFVRKRDVITHMTGYMDLLVADSKKPYALRSPEPPLPNDPISQQLLPVYTKARLKFTANDTMDNLLLAMLAVQAYRQEHKAYPPNLQALVPTYLSAVPTDPFAPSGPLQYKVTGKGYLLYSIGPDGKDNGGTPSKDGQKAKNGPGKPVITESSTGDIVAGVNKQ